jgi:CheY-like chemotaxis protein
MVTSLPRRSLIALGNLSSPGRARQANRDTDRDDELEKTRSAVTAEFASRADILDLANVVIHDLEGKILHWTTGCERLYGWSRQEAVGQIVHHLLKTLGKRLRSLGYEVVEADSGAAAMAELATLPEVAMIFTDMVMPGGMTGYELAQAALALKPDIKVLFTSGYAEPAIARLGQKTGAWLKKPYTADELAEKVREVLRHPEE